jgi:hypothetical protein
MGRKAEYALKPPQLTLKSTFNRPIIPQPPEKREDVHTTCVSG